MLLSDLAYVRGVEAVCSMPEAVYAHHYVHGATLRVPTVAAAS